MFKLMLTPREFKLFEMLTKGLSVREIAETGEIGVGIAQIYNIKKNIQRKLAKYHNLTLL